MKKVITYGTYDLLHQGHINILRRAKELGDYLIVALSTDEFNWNEKKKKCYFSYEKRKQLLEESFLISFNVLFHICSIIFTRFLDSLRSLEMTKATADSIEMTGAATWSVYLLHI